MKLEIYSDIICPWCYVGKARLDKALETLGDKVAFEVAWRPFELNPSMPPEGMCRKEYRTCKFGSWERSLEMDRDITAKAAADGLTFNLDKLTRTPNTFNCHRLLWFAEKAGNQEAIAGLLFQRYFTEGADIGDINVLADLAAEAGLDKAEVKDFLQSDQGIAEVKEEAQKGIRLGISGVPAFVLEGDVIASGAQTPEHFIELLTRVYANYSV
ncbi:MAG: DsbA family oxidoreductase [Candidatus Obscuribacterales bacterium]